MSNVAHPILPTAIAIKQAMDEIYEAAKEVFDLSPWLDEQGRLPFKNLLPMLQAAPNSGSAGKDAIIKSMVKVGRILPLDNEEVYKIADDAEIRVEMNLGGAFHLPSCKAIGRRAFILDPTAQGLNTKAAQFCKNASSFALLETLGEEAFYVGDPPLGLSAIDTSRMLPFSEPLSFPKLKTIGNRALLLWPSSTNLENHIYLPSIEKINNGIRLRTTWDANGFVPEGSDPWAGGKTFLHLPHKTVEEVKAMRTAGNFGTYGVYQCVCSDGTYEPPNQHPTIR